jgi:parallel beta-helix repeat protein
MQKNYLLRKELIIGIILLFVATLIIPSTAQDIEKSPSTTLRSSTLYVGGNGPNNYTRIQDAIDNASTGDTVFVYHGTYYENIVVEKSINLIGENRTTTIIDGSENDNVVFIKANETTVRQFTIRNSGEGIENAGIFLLRSDENNINENIISHNKGNGVLSHYSRKNTYSGNTVTSNNYYGFNIRHSNQTIILNNTVIENLEAGIVMVDSNQVVIENNSVSTTTFEGIGLWRCKESVVEHNTVTQTNFSAIFLYFSERIFLANNELGHNYQHGLLFDNSSNNTIWSNTIRENTLSGIEIDQSSHDNLFCYNLVNNSVNAYDAGDNTWNRPYPGGGNYWSDFLGSDAMNGPQQDIPGPDGVGDAPYPILGGSNQDQYPLMSPYGMTQLAFTFHGGFGFSGTITNVGNTTAFMVCFQQTVEGGFILRGRHSLFVVPKPLLPGEEVIVKSRMIFGFGKIQLTIAIWADNAPYMERTSSATVILFFIIGLH